MSPSKIEKRLKWFAAVPAILFILFNVLCGENVLGCALAFGAAILCLAWFVGGLGWFLYNKKKNREETISRAFMIWGGLPLVLSAVLFLIVMRD